MQARLKYEQTGHVLIDTKPGSKAKRRNSFWTVAPILMWLLSSPQQPRGWKDSPTI